MSTTDTPTAPAANPNCHACEGTGTDQAFGGTCSECWIDARGRQITQKRYEGIATRASDRAYTPGERMDGRTFGGNGRSNWKTEPATPKQIGLIRKLIAERPAEHPHVKLAETRLSEGITGGKASEIIDHLMQNVERGRSEIRETRNEDQGSGIVNLDLSDLPSGRYAVERQDGTHLKLRVDNVDEGKWAGWVFVKDANEYGHGQKYGSQRPGQNYRGKVAEALRTVLDDPRAAVVAYGRSTSTCGMCGRKLEDEKTRGRDGLTSVERGIGPWCAEKHGWL